MRRIRHNPEQRVCRIDVSGLASILLVLIVSFIVMTPSEHGGVGIDLPRVRRATPVRNARREDAMIVIIMRAGDVFFGNSRIRPSELPARIREYLRRGTEKRAYIRADARAHYGAVLRVLDGVRLAGIEDVVFLVDERKAPLPTQ